MFKFKFKKYIDHNNNQSFSINPNIFMNEYAKSKKRL